MNGSVKNERTGLEIIAEMLSITRDMSGHLSDADYITDALDRRELLMIEYDAVTGATPYAEERTARDKPEIRRMIGEIMELDKTVNAALCAMRAEVKQEVASSNAQKKVLNYTNQAISASGSYMDFKK